MEKFRQTIRLYRVHDLDLITFMETHEFNITKAIYCALTAFSNNDYFVIEIPPKRTNELCINNKVYAKQLTLDMDKDRKAVELLSKIKKGGRNNFLKNLLRMYLCNPIAESYLENEADIYDFIKKFEIMKQNRRRANAGDLKLVKKTSTNSETIKADESKINTNEDLSIEVPFNSVEDKHDPAEESYLEDIKETDIPKDSGINSDEADDEDEIFNMFKSLL